VIVLPNDTNQLGTLFGGRLLQFMDVCGAVAAQRHAGRICVTAAVDSVEFKSPISLGEIVNLEARVNRAFKSSMEVEINVWAEAPGADGDRRWCNRAYYTFVAVDENRKPVIIPPVVTENEEDETRFASAARRRELRLVIAGRLELKDAQHLRNVFEEVFIK
jgi:acyl-CoA hydrolase